MQLNLDTHLSDEMLELYSLGYLAEDKSLACEDHVLICESCQVRLDQADEFVRIVSTALREPEKKAIPSRSFLSWLWRNPAPVWALSAAALVLSVGVVSVRQPQKLERTEVSLQASRGAGDSLLAHARSGIVTLVVGGDELTRAASYRVEVVTADGGPFWSGSVQAATGPLRIPVTKKMASGRYWVRVFGSNGTDLLQEYGLEVK